MNRQVTLKLRGLCEWLSNCWGVRREAWFMELFDAMGIGMWTRPRVSVCVEALRSVDTLSV
jgi:hypothetical protein